MTFGANTNLTDLIELVIASNTKLDTIISLLQAAPPNPVHSLDDLYQVLTDIHLDTTSIDQKLLVVRDAVTGPEDYESGDTHDNLAWNIYRIRRATASNQWPPTTLVPDIQSQVHQIFDIFDAHYIQMKIYLSEIDQMLTYAFPNLGVSITGFSQVYSGYIEVVRNTILALKGSLGVPANALNIGPEGSRDVIQLLSLLGSLNTSQVGQGLPPEQQCTDAYISGGMALVPTVFDAWPATIWAVWPDPPPTGISFGTTFGIGVDNTELVNSNSNWNNYYLYVASDAANCGLYIGGDVNASFTRYPTNVWLDLNGYTNNLSVFVGGENALRCYLCNAWVPPSTGGGPWGGGGSSSGGWFGPCEVQSSQVVTITYPPGTSPADHTRHCTVLSGIGLVNTTYVQTGGATYNYSVADAVTTTNMQSTRVKLINGPRARLFWVQTDGDPITHELTTPNQSYVIPDDTIYFSIDNYVSNEVSPGEPFTVELCPPGSY